MLEGLLLVLAAYLVWRWFLRGTALWEKIEDVVSCRAWCEREDERRREMYYWLHGEGEEDDAEEERAPGVRVPHEVILPDFDPEASDVGLVPVGERAVVDSKVFARELVEADRARVWAEVVQANRLIGRRDISVWKLVGVARERREKLTTLEYLDERLRKDWGVSRPIPPTSPRVLKRARILEALANVSDPDLVAALVRDLEEATNDPVPTKSDQVGLRVDLQDPSDLGVPR